MEKSLNAINYPKALSLGYCHPVLVDTKAWLSQVPLTRLANAAFKVSFGTQPSFTMDLAGRRDGVGHIMARAVLKPCDHRGSLVVPFISRQSSSSRSQMVCISSMFCLFHYAPYCRSAPQYLGSHQPPVPGRGPSTYNPVANLVPFGVNRRACPQGRIEGINQRTSFSGK